MAVVAPIEDILKAFEFLDKDCDGAISTSDLRQALTEAGQKAPSVDQLVEMLADFDDREDGCESPTSDATVSTASSSAFRVDFGAFQAYSEKNQRYVSFHKLCKLAQVAQARAERATELKVGPGRVSR
jgi:hypothetical protein